MNISLITGNNEREKLTNFTAAVQKLRAEFKSLDPAVLEGDIEAAQRQGVIVIQLQALDRALPQMTKEADKQKRAGQVEGARIKLKANEDVRLDRITVDQYEAELARAASVERGWAS